MCVYTIYLNFIIKQKLVVAYRNFCLHKENNFLLSVIKCEVKYGQQLIVDQWDKH